MVEQNWYAVLGITSSATAAEIKRAFRKLAHIYHPDKNSTPVYFEQFNQIKKAYEIIGNTTSKQLYDKSLQLEGRSTKSQPSIQSIQDVLNYFHLFEKEMQQTDFRFTNYDRIKWKLNYPLFMPLFKEFIQSGNFQEQQKLLKQALYVLSFLPLSEIIAYQPKLENCFLNKDQIITIRELIAKKKLEAKWEQLKIPLVAIVSALLCLAIFLLAQ
jgi:molecular chaperone DnaJ